MVEVFDNSGGTGSPVAQAVETDNTVTFDDSDDIEGSTEYWVRVTPNDNVNADPNCSLQSVTTQADNVPPVLQGAVINNGAAQAIILNYNEPLAEEAVDTSKLSVTVNGSPRSLITAVGEGSGITIILSSAVSAGNVVVISYTPGASGDRIKDVAGNFAVGFTNQAVTNNVV